MYSSYHTVLSLQEFKSHGNFLAFFLAAITTADRSSCGNLNRNCLYIQEHSQVGVQWTPWAAELKGWHNEYFK